MLKFPIFILLPLFLQGLNCQCYNCAKYWKMPCNVSRAGYQCQAGTKFVPLTREGLDSKYLNCSPLPQLIEEVNSFCCVYSPKMGCTVALDDTLFRYAPQSKCEYCESRCQCASNIESSSVIQSWNWRGLSLIGLFGVTIRATHTNRGQPASI